MICWRCNGELDQKMYEGRPFIYHFCSDGKLTANKNKEFNKNNNCYLKFYKPKTQKQAVNHIVDGFFSWRKGVK